MKNLGPTSKKILTFASNNPIYDITPIIDASSVLSC